MAFGEKMHARGRITSLICAVACSAVALTVTSESAEARPVIDVSSTAIENLAGGGAKVSGEVRWNLAAIARAGHNDRFTLNLIAVNKGSKQAQSLASRTVDRAAGKERINLRLGRRGARRLRQAGSVWVTATQQYDSPRDRDKLYEHNYVASERVSSSTRGAKSKRACSVRRLGPKASLRGCNLLGADLGQANLARADLRSTDLRGTSFTGANLQQAKLTGALWDSDQQSAFTEPNDNGATVVSAIDSAKQSVDIVIYIFGGPNIVGQPGAEGALMRAVKRGVNVRLILNGQIQDKACLGLTTAQQAVCAWNKKYDPIYAAQTSLQAAAKAAGAGAGKVTVQFANNNFNITHQKTVLIDATDASGNALPADKLPATAKALMMTGNLQASPSLWGQRYVYDPGQKKTVLINPNYDTDPAAGCISAPATAGGGKPCAVEWGARDFGVVLTDQNLVSLIQGVFVSDLQCGGPAATARSNTNNLLATTGPDTWSNGATYNGLYPDPAVGGYFQTPSLKNPTLQGNANARWLAQIDAAQQSLTVYNEEMADSDVINHLVAKAKQLSPGSVRVVMAGAVNANNDNAEDFNTLNDAGVQIRLLDSDSDPANVVYIHAKSVVSDGTNAVVGSQNFSFPSMAYNRELGLVVTNSSTPAQGQLPSVQALAAITSTFETDWANGKPWTDQPVSPSAVGTTSGGFPMVCGAIPTRTGPPPSVE